MNIGKSIWFSKLGPESAVPFLFGVLFACFIEVTGLISIDPNKVYSSI